MMKIEGYNSRCTLEEINVGEDLKVVGIVVDIAALSVVGVETKLFIQTLVSHTPYVMYLELHEVLQYFFESYDQVTPEKLAAEEVVMSMFYLDLNDPHIVVFNKN